MANDMTISVRMEIEDVQAIEDYLSKHPELANNRSLLIKNVLREYFNRDAEVPAEKTVSQEVAERDVCVDLPGTKTSEIRLTLTRRHADTLRGAVDSGDFLTEGDFIRTLLKNEFMSNESLTNRVRENYERADKKIFMQ